MEPPKIIVGVPDKWKSRSDIVTSIAGDSGGYLFAGTALVKIGSDDHFTLEVYEHDPRLRHAFEVAGGGRYTEAELDAIAEHTFTLYAICEGGSCDAAWKMMRAASGLVRAGGLGVKVESSGVAIRPEVWCERATSGFLPNLYHSFVVHVGEPGHWFSCGMHNLGRRDVIVNENLLPADAGELMDTFQLYELLENPELGDGHTFSADAQSPKSRMTIEPCETYPPGDPFHNPYGMWRLTRVKGKK